MAMPIKPTPELTGKEATKFEKTITANLSAPLKVNCAPSLAKAKASVFKSAKKYA